MSDLSPEEAAALKEVFREQAEELLETYGRQAMELDGSAKPQELLKGLQRVVHTLKGDSMALELEKLATMAHRLEDLLAALSHEANAVGQGFVDLLLACGDAMSEMLGAYCAVPPRAPNDHAALRRRLDGAMSALQASSEGGLERKSPRYRLSLTFSRDCKMKSVGTFLVRQRLQELGEIVSMTPDPDGPDIETARSWQLEIETDTDPQAVKRAAKVPGVTARASLKVQEGAPLGAGRSEHAPSESTSGVTPALSAGNYLRVEVSKVDRIMNLVGELVIGRSMVAQAIHDLQDGRDDVASRLSDANNFLGRSLTELQAAVLKTRMVPVDTVFRRFPRVVREVARSSGKNVELEIRGASTELDKGIIDVIGEPLLHLVRNAIDHGLESEEDRRAARKSATGKLVIAAGYEGNHVHITVEDDGRGIDIDRVVSRATGLGLVTSEEAKSLGREEALDFIFAPGFTTRERVSTLSGRGIGLDVVKSTIESLKGTIEVTTSPSEGTRFLIRLPLTVAILQALLVRAADRIFALPLTSVLEIVRLSADQSGSILGNDVFRFRDRVIPRFRLRELLELQQSAGEASGKGFVLVVGEAERRVAMVVDRIVGEHELVVKPIEDPLARSPGIAGASILGDGKVVLILNVRGLTERRQRQNGRAETLA